MHRVVTRRDHQADVRANRRAPRDGELRVAVDPLRKPQREERDEESPSGEAGVDASDLASVGDANEPEVSR